MDNGVPDLDELDPSDKKQILRFAKDNPQIIATLDKKPEIKKLYRAIMMEYRPDILKKIYTWIKQRDLPWVFSLVLSKVIPDNERIVYVPSLIKTQKAEQEIICFPQKITPKDIEYFQIWLPVDFEDGSMFEWGDIQGKIREVKLWTCSAKELGELMEMKVQTDKDQTAFAWEILRRAKHKKVQKHPQTKKEIMSFLSRVELKDQVKLIKALYKITSDSQK